MADYNLTYTGAQVNAAIGAVTTALNNGGIQTVNNFNNTIANYTTITQLNNKVSSVYPVGAIYITSTNTNPGTFLGGTWTLFDKGLKYVYVNTYAPSKNNTNCTDVAVSGWYQDHGVFLVMDFTPKVAITDTELEMFTIDPNTFGLTQFPNLQRVNWFSDGGQAVIAANLTAAGKFSTIDVFVRNTSSPASLAGGTNLSSVTVNLVVRHGVMLDSACDKFYWKRTA